MNGKLVVIEGSDGAGKATQLRLLKTYLTRNHITHKTISIPRYKANMYGSFITKYLHGDFGNPLKIDPYFTALPYAIDRLLTKPLIEAWLKTNQVVIADRYAYSNMAFGAAKLNSEKRPAFSKWVETLEFKENKIPKPELVLYLYVPVVFSQELMAGRKKDGHERDVNYQKEVEKVYLELSKGRNWVKIACVSEGKLLSKQLIHQEIIKILRKKQIIRVAP